MSTNNIVKTDGRNNNKYTEYNSNSIPWRLNTTNIFHKPELYTNTDYDYTGATNNTLNIEASGSDINFYTNDNYKTIFNNDVSINGIIEAEKFKGDGSDLTGFNLAAILDKNHDASFNNVDIIGSLKVAYNTNTTSYLGKAVIGNFVAPDHDTIGFSHSNNNNASNYALMQNSSGTTSLNARVSQQIRFCIGGFLNDKMILTKDGCLGIGVSTPTEKLEVDGSGVFTGSISAAKDTDITSYFGRAAIGARSTGLLDGASFAHLDYNNTDSYALLQSPVGTTVINAASGQDIIFRIKNETKMILTHTGKLGIGVSNPTKKLEVDDDIICSGSILAAKNTDTTSYLGKAAIGYAGHYNYAAFSHVDMHTNSNYALLQHESGRTFLNAGIGEPINFRINNATKMVLTSDGSFGIGIINPTKKLEVVGDITCSGSISAAKDTNTTSYLGKAAIGLTTGLNDVASFSHVNMNTIDNFALMQTSNGGTIINASDQSRILFSIGGQSAVQNGKFMCFDKNANLGIGTIFPTCKLHVIGECHITGHFAVNQSITCYGPFTCYGPATATIFNQTSDERVKFNKKIIKTGLNIIKKLTPTLYDKSINLDNSLNLIKEAGFIAQEVLQIDDISFAVSGGGNEDYYKLNSNSIFTYNVAATKELDNLVTGLSNEVYLLKKENNMIKNTLNTLLIELGYNTI